MSQRSYWHLLRRDVSWSEIPAVIYLIHFDQPFHHAQHYVGSVDYEASGLTPDEALARRMEQHLRGRGARLLEHVVAHGIGLTLARTWLDTKAKEARLKVKRHHREQCPVCRGRAPRLDHLVSLPEVSLCESPIRVDS